MLIPINSRGEVGKKIQVKLKDYVCYSAAGRSEK